MPNKMTFIGLYMDARNVRTMAEAAVEATRLAEELDQMIVFRFAGILVEVHPRQTPADVVTQYNRAVKAAA